MRQPAGRIGITGGSGFIGSCVADRMTTAGSDVVALDTRPPQRSAVAYRHVDVLDLAEVVQATRDLDAVFHLAGVSDASDALARPDRKSTRLNSSHSQISYAVFCLKKKKKDPQLHATLHQMEESHIDT